MNPDDVTENATTEAETTITKTITTTEPVNVSQSVTVGEVLELAPSPDSQPLPDLTAIVTLGAITAVVTWGVIEALKMMLKQLPPFPWWTGMMRMLAILVGAGVGTALYGSLGGIGSGWPWGAAIGGGAGALCTIIVATIKKRIKK